MGSPLDLLVHVAHWIPDVIVLTAMGEERAMDVKEAPKGN